MSNYFDNDFSIANSRVFVFKTGRWKQNSYILHDQLSKKMTIIDPGGDSHRLINFVESTGSEIVCVCLTHAHHDHVGALKEICEHFDQNFYIHQDDLKLMRRAPLFAYSFEARKMEVPVNNHIFYPGENSNFHLDLKFIHTPGHTPGGVVIYIDRVAFTGDTLLNKMIGRTDLPGASVPEIATSITNFLSLLEDDVMLFPGHGEPWVAKEAKIWWEQNRENTPQYRTEDNERGY